MARRDVPVRDAARNKGDLMNVLVLLPVAKKHQALLEKGLPEASFIYVAPRSAVGVQTTLSAGLAAVSDEQLAAADVVVGNLPPERVAAAPKLKLLQLNSAGYDNYLAAGCVPANVALCCASGAYGQAVSEHLFAMLLACMKRLPSYCDLQRRRTWDDLGPVISLVGARVLVLGAGDIGAHFAQLCRAMGAHVEGVKRNVAVCDPVFEAVHPMDDLLQAAGTADVVASFLPSSPATQGLVGEKFFSACKQGAFFVNGGRGDLVDQDALVAALEDGHLAGAALDVCTPEPLPADSPLWDAPNLLLTPHVSGNFHLEATLDNIVAIAADNLRRFAAGEPLRNAVAH